jgi:UDP-N-acetylmuramate dehydrogenase
MMNACIQNGLGGIEFLAGIPGTAGGAVVMNAGAHGRETGDVLESVTIVVPGGDVVERPAGDLTFSYRACRLPQGAVVTGARFHVEREGRKVVSERVNAHLERRRRALPQGFPSAGSVFRNPEGGFAGRLVDEAGLKGRRIGGAMISPVHGNVIVNTGGATAGDILALVNLAREEVLRRTGVELEPEIRVAGS